jgi:hypothetical protein
LKRTSAFLFSTGVGFDGAASFPISAVKAASDAAEQASKMQTLLGNSTAKVNAELATFATQAKRSKFELQSMASDFAALARRASPFWAGWNHSRPRFLQRSVS